MLTKIIKTSFILVQVDKDNKEYTIRLLWSFKTRIMFFLEVCYLNNNLYDNHKLQKKIVIDRKIKTIDTPNLRGSFSFFVLPSTLGT